jgi:hypothetical protein
MVPLPLSAGLFYCVDFYAIDCRLVQSRQLAFSNQCPCGTSTGKQVAIVWSETGWFQWHMTLLFNQHPNKGDVEKLTMATGASVVCRRFLLPSN